MEHQRSHNLFLVILKLHNDGLDVLSLALPLLKALFSVRIEVLFLLVLESLIVEGLMLVVDEVLLRLDVLIFCLLLEVVCDFHSSLSLLLSFLLFGYG